MQRRKFIAASLGLVTTAFAPGADAEESQVLLAKPWHAGINPADYWVSEKLDGVRGVWDGKTLRFRSGNPVHAPAWFIAALPPFALDGELWIARERFDAVSAILRKDVPVDAEWRQVQYMIFEAPGAPGSFSDRIAHISKLIAMARQPWLQQIEQFRVASRADLKAKLTEITQQGGEGLVLHKTDARYTTGRSDVLLKFKPQEDAEAKVVAHVPGKGRNAGKLGALLVETPEGRRFRIGTGFTDAQRSAPPAIGSMITYRYRELTSSGLPRFASYLRPYDAL